MKNYLLLLLAVAFYLAPAQDPVLNYNKLPRSYMDEDYVSSREEWGGIDEEDMKVWVDEGGLNILNRLNNRTRMYIHPYNIEPNSNYYIEGTFEWIEGRHTGGSGLVFNYACTVKESCYQFMVARDGHFKIFNRINGTENMLCDWTISPYVTDTANALGVLAKGKTMYFYINNRLVYQMERPPFIGNYVGYNTASKTQIRATRFKIYYNPPSVNVINDNEEHPQEDVPGITSGQDDAFPVLSADGKMMFFSRCKDFTGVGLKRRIMMYTEYIDSTGRWCEAKEVPGSINAGGIPEVAYVSPDKNSLYIIGTYDSAGKYVIDERISVSTRTDTGWSNPKVMDMDGYHNADIYETYALSANNRVLIMSAQGETTYGQKDLYVSFKQGDKWSRPQNMGATVNSFGNENSPCLAPDNVTLYYLSGGKPGYGMSDVFVTRRLDDTWTNWSEAQNLGPNINSKYGDYSITVDAYGRYAYRTHEKSSGSKMDIKKFTIPEEARPKPVVIVTGKVYNLVTGQPMGAEVFYEDLETGYEEGTAISSTKDGSFVLVLPYGVNYGFTARQKGFISESAHLNLKVDSVRGTYVQDSVNIYVMPLTTGTTLQLHNIFFEVDQYRLQDVSFAELDRLAGFMYNNPTLAIEVGGHTDKGGERVAPELLTALSQNRANAVKEYLMSKGVAAERINAVGYGNTKPVSTDQRKNRRVEIQITKL